MRMVLHELQLLEELPPLLNLTLVGRVVMDRQHNLPTSRLNLFAFNNFDVHQQRERATSLLALEEVSCV